jgi:hypothetical protein
MFSVIDIEIIFYFDELLTIKTRRDSLQIEKKVIEKLWWRIYTRKSVKVCDVNDEWINIIAFETKIKKIIAK